MGFLQVLLLILKILGILFVSALALLLIATAFLLFVPLRYRLQGHKAADYAVEARLSWLLRILRVNLTYASESKLFYEVRLFRFVLLSNDETWKAENEEKKKQKAEKKARKAEKKKQKQKEKRAKAKAKQREKRGGVPNGNSRTGKRLTEASQKNDNILSKNEQNQSNSSHESQTAEHSQSNEEKKNWVFRIFVKIKEVIGKLKNLFRSVLSTVKTLWHKADTVLTFLKDETNKAAFGAGWSMLVQILKHIGPTKIKGYLAFGMDDPATTGYILAVFGIFYSKFGKSFSIQPNFEEKQFETKLRAKGRIRMSRLLYLALKLWRNKEFKSLLDNIKQLKTDIKTNGG